eukprot:9976920-Ditylum_brightwellii.AAC.1
MLEENEKTIKDAKKIKHTLHVASEKKAMMQRVRKRARSKEIRSKYLVGASFQTVAIQRDVYGMGPKM